MRSMHPFMLTLALVAAPVGAMARDNIAVAGSSTVLPYATIVAELFADNFPQFSAPVVESGGTSGGLKQFCEGPGLNTIDIADASRRIREGERAVCARRGVTGIIEVLFGYDGIVLAGDVQGPDYAFNAADIYRALAREVVADGRLVPNPVQEWSAVDPTLPERAVLAFVPGSKHGTREVFDDDLMLRGCRDSGAAEVISGLVGDDEKRLRAACTDLRHDGRVVEIDGDYTETLARIGSDSQGIGVFGLSFYENNTDRLKVASIDGVLPSTETIASGQYPVSRPLFFYIKKQHVGVIPGLKEFAAFFVSDPIAGPGGPLADYGLVPDPQLAETQRIVADEQTIPDLPAPWPPQD